MKYRKLGEKHKRFNCDSGCPDKLIYKSSYDENGRIKLVCVGKDSLYALIQASADSVDINVILKMFEKTGDVSLLNQRVGQFGDFTDMPKTMAEVLNLVNDAKQEFNELPLDIRAKFNHSVDEYIAGIGSQAWFEKLNLTANGGAKGEPIAEPVSTEPIATE